MSDFTLPDALREKHGYDIIHFGRPRGPSKELLEFPKMKPSVSKAEGLGMIGFMEFWAIDRRNWAHWAFGALLAQSIFGLWSP